ncbi:MAG TPA: 2-oxo-4-hydroxy-4-carboxy-5-ureidoimidazoline decarboxylase [Actinomycetes bacterium]|nr:2-oxo-4-hydroxy-4-carboxy-5-ureidoimidazoline decarboxylase [Actinomycetes bacterium]
MTEARLDQATLDEVDGMLTRADTDLTALWPGDPGTRQPVHTLYVPADRAAPDVVAAAGREAQDALAAHAGDPRTMAAVVGLPADLVTEVWPRLLAKLAREPVEDLRLDLEDGYGRRDDDEEDGHATAAGSLLAALAGTEGAPFVSGVRMKSLERPTRRRGIRSLDLVLAAAGGLPPGFVVTLPKVTSLDQVRAMVVLCERLEAAHGLTAGSLRFEVQVETPQAVLGADGVATVAPMLHAAAGRCTGLHYGTYDYSASLGVAAAYQSMEHPVADHAKDVMQVAAAQTGVRVSDGSTNVLPVGDTEAVRGAWALHARLVRRSLERGIYQGWDLHAAQLPTRYLATYAFYRAGKAAAAQRLRAYADKAGSGVLDEPATAYALAGFLLRGVDCGALDLDEVLAATALDRRALDGFARRPAGAVGGLDELPDDALRARLLEVCSSPRWADLVAAARPFGAAEEVYAAGDRALAALSEADIDQALAGHPRIGERSHSAASRREQSGVSGDETLAALAEGNREYEARFGHVYLVCASGRSGEELLAVLRSRLRNDAATERRVVREELGKINRLRLQRLVEEG